MEAVQLQTCLPSGKNLRYLRDMYLPIPTTRTKNSYIHSIRHVRITDNSFFWNTLLTEYELFTLQE